jgi:N-methylhydantoinase B
LSRFTYPAVQAEALEKVFEMILSPLDEACALVSPDRGALLVKARGPGDIATLTEAAYTSHQYLKLQHGDIAVLNDPSAGGLSLSDLTLVAGASRNAGISAADLLIVVRVKLQAKWSSSGKLDDEGLRIPPTPLVSNGHLNSELFQAISRHPNAAKNLEANGLATIEKLMIAVQNVRKLAADPFGEFSRTDFKLYQSQSSRSFQHAMSRLPLGTSIVSTSLPSGETVKLQLEIKENLVEFDFKGTDESNLIGLSERVTIGAAIWSTLSWLDYRGPITSGLLNHFHATTPLKSLVSARHPKGVFRGSFVGAPVICNLVELALSHATPKNLRASGAKSEAWISIENHNKSALFSRSLAPGQGAINGLAGLDAYAEWSEAARSSIELAERSSPLIFKLDGLAPSAHGKGHFAGGKGTILDFKVAENSGPLKLNWIFATQSTKHEGRNGGKSGKPSRIEVLSPTGKKSEFLQNEGSTDLMPGSHVTVFSSGGGAFGAPLEEKVEEP